MGRTTGLKISSVKTTTEYTSFSGGLNLETPAMSIKPGNLISCLNYEAEVAGGYRRLDGYEIYDGQAAPSDATYLYCEVTLTDTVTVGDTITETASGATGIVIINSTTSLCITKTTGTFTATGTFTVGGVAKGSITAVPVDKGEATGLGNATALAAAADVYRDDIAAPTGSGAIRGIGLLKGVVYCFRDNAGGTAGLIYKATTSGWTAITLYYELSFDTGISIINDGDTVTQLVSGATGLVKRTVLESGTWAGTAAGRLILGSITGTFDATNDLQVTGATKATSTSLATQITLLPGGRYETVEYNFFGSTDTKRMYGCDGVNRGFEFDGSVYVPIVTGMTTDTPEHVIAHKKHLFFSFKGSSQNSGIGTPYVWTALTGATEIGLGDDVVGYSIQAGDALAIFTRNSTSQLTGSSSADFVLGSLSPDTGAIPRTIQTIGEVYCLDDRGIINITSSDKYGNFAHSTVSNKVQSIIDLMRAVAVASVTYKSRNQYRLYGSDGTGICMTVSKGDEYASHSFLKFKYPVNVACAISGEDPNGKDVIFFGATNGNVYQADKGSSFDGEEIEATLRFPFNNSKSPRTIKTYRRAVIEMVATSYSVVRFHVNFSYGDPDIARHLIALHETQGAGGYWDTDNWESFYYDSFVVSRPSFSINGDGTNIGLVAYSKSAIDLGHKIDGVVIHYTLRRDVR